MENPPQVRLPRETWGQRETMIYSDGFKERMVRRMAGAECISANMLAQEVGIGQPTLSRWLRDARSVGVTFPGNFGHHRSRGTREDVRHAEKEATELHA